MNTRSNRRLAAIMFTDIEGYTALMQSDESKGVVMRQRHREVFNATTEQFSGNILQYYGDGTLSIFDSVVDAVKCGYEMQLLFQKDPVIPVRIGIHLGDIIVAEDEVIGDAVNFAARIESMAIAGSVLISDRVQHDIKNHEGIQCKSLGLYELKNVQRPVEVFAISNSGMIIPEANQVSEKVKPYRPEVEHNLPNPATSFIGRKEEIEKINTLLEQHRLLTLYGPGGSGKTRLALEVAKQNLASYPGGVFFFDLAPLENPEMVTDTFANILKVNKGKDLSLEASIAQNITQEKVLLVIDNCEHLIDKCAALIKYLLTNTELPKMLVTTREVLNFRAELKYYVPALTLPERSIKLNEIDQYESLLLFRDRAQVNNPDFALTDATVGSVAAICQRLDGIPLALELAAARVNIMDVQTILKRLENQFKILRSGDRSGVPRQKTIRATLDWSHELLTDSEKLLFHRLAIFSGDFDLEDVETICSCDELYEEDVIEYLSNLVDKSLVVIVEKKGNRRYRLLELMKEYGKEKMAESDMEKLKEKFGQFYLARGRQSYKEQHERTMYWMEWLTLEQDNIESALELLSNDPSKLIELAGCICWYWHAGSNYLVGSKYLERALERYTQEDILRGKALAGYGTIKGNYGDLKTGLEIAHEGLDMLRKSNASFELLSLLFHTAILELFSKNYTESENLCDEGSRLANERKDPHLILRYKTWKGGVLTNQFLADEAEPIVEENLRLSKEMNATFDIDFNSHFYADIPMVRGEYGEAAIRYLDATQSAASHGNMFMGAIDLQGVGMCLCMLGQYQEGLKLVGASIAIYDHLGMVGPDNDFWITLFGRTAGKTIAEIGEERSNELMAEGSLMRFEDAVAYAEEWVTSNI